MILFKKYIHLSQCIYLYDFSIKINNINSINYINSVGKKERLQIITLFTYISSPPSITPFVTQTSHVITGRTVSTVS